MTKLINQITHVEYNKDSNTIHIGNLGAFKILDLDFIETYLVQVYEMTEDEAKKEAAKFVWTTSLAGAVTATHDNDHVVFSFHQDQEVYLRYKNLDPLLKKQMEDGYKERYEVIFNEEQRKLFELGIILVRAYHPDLPNKEEVELLYGMLQSLPQDNQDANLLTGRTMQGFCL